MSLLNLTSVIAQLSMGEDTTVYTIKGGAYVKVTLSFDIAQASG